MTVIFRMIDTESAQRLLAEVRKKKAEYDQALQAFASTLSVSLEAAHWIAGMEIPSGGSEASNGTSLTAIQLTIFEFVRSRSGIAVSKTDIAAHTGKECGQLAYHLKNMVDKQYLQRMRKGYYTVPSSKASNGTSHPVASANHKVAKLPNGDAAPRQLMAARGPLEDLNPVCQAIYKLLQAKPGTAVELAKRSGKSRSYVNMCITTLIKARWAEKAEGWTYKAIPDTSDV